MAISPPRTRAVTTPFLMLVLLCFQNADANEHNTDWRAFNTTIVNEQILPAYQALSAASVRLDETVATLCAKEKADDRTQILERTRSAFHDTMDAWQSIQHVNFGPVEYDMRLASLQFWPDKKNHIGKHLAQLLQGEPSDLDHRFALAGVSIKGLPAIERILFAEQALAQLAPLSQRCQALRLMSQNVAHISSSLWHEWKGYMAAQFSDASQVDGYFEDDIDAATALLKTIIEPLEVIRDLKLERPLGSAADKAKIKRLESWRSRRSLRNIQLNLGAIDATLPALALVLPNPTVTDLRHKLERIKLSMSHIPAPIEDTLHNPKTHQQLKGLSTELDQMQIQMEQAMANAGIHLGFNSRDGD